MIRFVLFFLPALLSFVLEVASQPANDTALIEPCACPVVVDSSFKTRCGYLLVPENRKKQKSKTIKLPFILVRSKNPAKKKDPVLFTSGGPGNSSLSWVLGITKGTLPADRDCIAFEQRGTRYAVPYLRSFELDTAIKEAYRKNLSKDSMVLEGVKRYKKRLLERGIDLAGYNTDETVADIHDLLKALQIDSVNLIGGSYSGGLMLAVLQKDPSRIRSLVLDAPLPMFVPIDQEEPNNFMQALHLVFERAKNDSADRLKYGDLKSRFHRYFTAISNTRFSFPYLEKGTSDSIRVQYTKNELLDAILQYLFNPATIRDLPFVVTEIINGRHAPYIKRRLDDVFLKNGAPDGMRISVYCADQATYHNPLALEQLYAIYPYLKGYHINDVYKAMCDCWDVPPVNAATKQPFYSGKPVLLGDGELDPACRPLYMDMLHHYLPNSQRVLFRDRSHGAFGWEEGRVMVQAFINNPFQKIRSTNPSILVY